jgi:hypothetical protein
LIGIAAERDGLQRERAVLNAVANEHRAQLNTLVERRRAVSEAWFIAYQASRICNDPSSTVHKVLADYLPRGSSDAELRPVADAMIHIASIIRSLPIEELAEPGRIASANGVDLRVAEAMVRAEYDRRNSDGFHGGLVRAAEHPDERSIDDQVRLIELETRARSELDIVEARKAAANAHLAALTEAGGFRSGFAVLTYFALVGIVFPLVLQSRRPVPDGPSIRVAVITAFITGLGSVLWYLSWLQRRLKL